VVKFTRTITVLLACILPIGAILGLYWVQDMTVRLGIIASLTGLFSVIMNLCTVATLSEIFQATAAYVYPLSHFELAVEDGVLTHWFFVEQIRCSACGILHKQ
jgi:uncharacterized membrane protein YpjA